VKENIPSLNRVTWARVVSSSARELERNDGRDGWDPEVERDGKRARPGGRAKRKRDRSRTTRRSGETETSRTTGRSGETEKRSLAHDQEVGRNGNLAHDREVGRDGGEVWVDQVSPSGYGLLSSGLGHELGSC
jgi:hypothetical protein